MRFLKVFLSAVFLSAFFNAYAQPITGAFGLKLGEIMWGGYLSSWPEGPEGREKGKVINFKDDFFDRVEFYLLPNSKRVYEISGIKIVQTLCGYEKERNALIDTLREKYGKYEQEIDKDSRALTKFKAKYKDREVSVSCGAKGEDWLLYVMYWDWGLNWLQDKERKMIEKEKIDASKL